MTLRLRFHSTHLDSEPEAEQEQVRFSFKSELPQHALAQIGTFLNDQALFCGWNDGEPRDAMLHCAKGFVSLVRGGMLMTSSKYSRNTPIWLAFFFHRLPLKSQVHTYKHHRSLTKGLLISFCSWPKWILFSQGLIKHSWGDLRHGTRAETLS